MNTKKIRAYVRLLRFDSWQVWLFNFVLGCILFAFPQIDRFILVLFAFTLATGGIFILNQYIDREDDMLNELKRDLPIASGDVSPSAGMMLSFWFIFGSVITILFVDFGLVPLFLSYVLLWIGYSAPPFCFKKRPVADVIVCGIGAGVLPFLIGLQTSYQLTLDFALPWMVRRYQDALLSVLPIFLVQSVGQIFQVVGDYEADSMAEISTFAVKYGKKASLRFANILLLITISLPIIYAFLNLSLIPYLSWYLIVFVCLVPCLLYAMNMLRDASEERLKTLRRISRQIGPAILLFLCVYVIIVKIILNTT